MLVQVLKYKKRCFEVILFLIIANFNFSLFQIILILVLTIKIN